MKEIKKHRCEVCDKELEKGEKVLKVDDDKFYCENHYNKFTTYYYDDINLGNENDSEEVDYSQYRCEECGEFLEEDDCYIVNEKILCSYCAMCELGFVLKNRYWTKGDLKIEHSWMYLYENGYSYLEEEQNESRR